MIDSKMIDLSNYDYDSFDAKAFYAFGVRRAIVGSQAPSMSSAMIEALRSEGISIEGVYDLPYFGSDGTTQPQITRAIALADKYSIPLVFADAEIDANKTNVPQWANIPTPSVAQRQAEFRWGINAIKAAGHTPGVYTNGGWWGPNMGGSTEWGACALWLATYGAGGTAALPIHTAAFGGWTTVWAHQYTSVQVIAGRVRDLSYLFGEEASVSNKEDELAQSDIDRISALEALVHDLQWAVFSGDEDRADSDALRSANVAYRIAEIVNPAGAADGSKQSSVASRAQAAITLWANSKTESGVTQADVDSAIQSAFSKAAKVQTGETK